MLYFNYITKTFKERILKCPQTSTKIKEFLRLENLGMVNPKDNTAINIIKTRLNKKILPVKIEIQNWANAINNNYIKPDMQRV